VGRKQYENRARRSWWSVHIEAWRRSGVSRRSYCRQHRLDQGTFARWLSVLDDVEALRVQAELKREERRLRRPLYAEAEDVLRQLPKLGIPMIMRRIERGENNGKAKIWSYPGMEKVVQQMRKKIDGVSELFTLDACRHGGMTELEEAELTDGQGRALSGHKTAQAYRGYAKETMQRALAATRKRHAHLLAQKQFEQPGNDAAAIQDQPTGDAVARRNAS